MTDTALRRMLDRATAPVPPALEADVFRRFEHGHRRSWRWTVSAAAVLLVAAGLAWSLERADRTAPSTRTGTPLVSVSPVGETDIVATWLPAGFTVKHEDSVSTTWAGDGGQVTVTIGAVWQPSSPASLERLAPGYAAERFDRDGTEHLVWGNGGSFQLAAAGLSEADAVRVAVGLVDRSALQPIEPRDGSVTVPSVAGLDDRSAAQQLTNAGFRVRWAVETSSGKSDGEVVAQRPAPDTQARPGSLVIVSVAGPGTTPIPAGERPSIDGVTAIAGPFGVAGWTPNRIFHTSVTPGRSEPLPVVFFGNQLAGYMFPGRGFVPTDQLLAPLAGDGNDARISQATTTVVGSAAPATTVVSGGTVSFHGVRVHPPETWTIRSNRRPADRMIVTMDPGSRPGPATSCGDDASASWIVLEPLPSDLGDFGRRCGPGFVDDQPFCQVLDGDVERRLYDGFDVLVTLHNVVGVSLSFDPVTTPDFEQSLTVAQSAVDQLLAGHCDAIADAGDPDLTTRGRAAFLQTCEQDHETPLREGQLSDRPSQCQGSRNVDVEDPG